MSSRSAPDAGSSWKSRWPTTWPENSIPRRTDAGAGGRVAGLARVLTVGLVLLGVAVPAAPGVAAPEEPASAAAADTHRKPCKPGVRLRGDAKLVAAVARHLEIAGLPTDGARRCVTVVVQLQREAQDAIGVRIADTQGRTAHRRVSDTATAAAVIESWARTDLLEPMLSEAEVPGPEPVVERPRTHDVRPAAPPGQPRAAPASAPAARFSVGIWVGASAANDGSLWADVALSACVEFAPLCLGGEVRGTIDLDETGAAVALDTDRGELDGLVTAQFLRALGSQAWHFSPGFGVGIGYTASDVDAEDAPEVGRGVARSDLTLRLATTAKIGVRISEDFHLAGRLGLELSPMARTKPERSPEGVLIAGVPRWYLRFALGIYYGTF